MECKNCGIALQGDYCSDCGQKVITERLTLKKINHDVFSIVMDVEKGLLHTIKMLFVSPGTVVRDYIGGKTVPYYHPFRYLVIWVTFSVALNLALGLYDRQQTEIQSLIGVSQSERVTKKQQEMQQEMKKYLNILPLFLVPFAALTSYWFFRRKGWNYAEHLVLNAYIQGQLALIGIPILLLSLVLPTTMPLFSGVLILSIAYGTYVFRGFFQVSTFKAVFKNILTHLLSYGMLIFLVMLISMAWLIFTL